MSESPVSAFDWIDRLAGWFGRFVPKWEVLCEGQGALKYVRGRAKVVEGPRLLWHWPVTTLVYVYWLNEQVVTMAPQMLTTKDGHSVAARAVMCLKIDDLKKFGIAVLEAEESVAEAAGSAVRNVVRASTFERLQDEGAPVDNALAAAVARVTGRFGVAIVSVRFTSLVRVRVLGHFAMNLVTDRAQGGKVV